MSAEISVKFQTQSGKVYRSIRDEIICGSLKPGTRLVRRTLGQRYGTSAIAVAEALWKLENDGLVESEPMYGSRVSAFTPKQIKGELLLRQALESEVARLCAERARELPADELMKKAAAVDAMMSVKHEQYQAEITEAHADFHRSLAMECGSEAIVQELDRVWFRHIMLYSAVNASMFPVPTDWHQSFLRSILSGDPDHADLAAREHIRYGGEHLEKVFRRLEAL
ncbi:MAG: GntR family transcriptional regulator [Verrucomicrobiales bacterium]|jgi:DNA-binding GntR family transcriptional regulator|nr:GntR family transcriptional regulator [Verrucomicrobiales bacterium]